MNFLPRVLLSFTILAQSLSIAVPGLAANSIDSKIDTVQKEKSRSANGLQAIKEELIYARSWDEGIREAEVPEADGCITRLEKAIRLLQKMPRERRLLLGCIHKLAMSSQDDRCFAVVLLENAMNDASDLQISKKELAALHYDLALLRRNVGDLDAASSDARKAFDFFNELQGKSGLTASESDSLNFALADCYAVLGSISKLNLQNSEAGSYYVLAAEKYWGASKRNLSLRCFMNAAILAGRVKDRKTLNEVLNRACALIKNSKEAEFSDSIFFASRLLYEHARLSLESENYSQVEEDCTKAIQLFGAEPGPLDQLAPGGDSSNRIAEKLFDTPLFNERACVDLALSYVPAPACTMPHVPANAILALPDSLEFDESKLTWKNYDDCHCAGGGQSNDKESEPELAETKWNEILSSKKGALRKQPIDDWLFARQEGFSVDIEPGLHTFTPKKIWDLYANVLIKTNRAERAATITKESQRLFIVDTVDYDDVFVFDSLLPCYTAPSIAGLRAAALLKNENLSEQIYSELKEKDSEQVFALCEEIGASFMQNDPSTALKWLYRAIPPSGFSASWSEDASGKTLQQRVREKVDKCLSSMGVNPSSSTERYKLSLEAERKGDEKVALEQLLRARELFLTREKGDPSEFKFNSEIGAKYLAFHDFDQALNYFRLERRRNVALYRKIISCYLQKGDYEGAVAASLEGYSHFPDNPEFFTQVLDRKPSSAREMLQEAQLRVFLDDIPTAVSMCEQAKKIDPLLVSDANRIVSDLPREQKTIRSYKLLVQCLALLKRGSKTEAIAVAEAAASANPTDDSIKKDLEQIKTFCTTGHKPAKTGIPQFESIERFDLNKIFFSIGKGSVLSQENTGDVDFAPYISEMEKKVKAIWRKHSPVMCSQSTKIQFVIARSGKLLKSSVSARSGSEFNDNNALASIREASFAPLPPGSPDEVNIEFSFALSEPASISEVLDFSAQSDVPCMSASLIDPSIYPILVLKEPEAKVVLPPLPQLDLPIDSATKSQPEGAEVLFFDEDLRAHSRAVESSRESKLANSFAVLLGSNGFWKDSIQLHNRALSLSPNSEKLRRNLSAAHMEYGGFFLSKRNYDKALHEFGLSVAVDPGNLKSLVEAERTLALEEQQQVSQSQRASAAFSAALAFDFPEEFLQRLTIDKMYLSATDSFGLVKFYLELGLLKSAIPQISKTLDLLSRSGSEDDAKIARDCLNMMGDICRYYAEPGSSSEKDRLRLASRYYRQSLFFGLRNKAASEGLFLVSKRAVELEPKSETNKKFLSFANSLQDAIKSGRDLPASENLNSTSGF